MSKVVETTTDSQTNRKCRKVKKTDNIKPDDDQEKIRRVLQTRSSHKLMHSQNSKRDRQHSQ